MGAAGRTLALVSVLAFRALPVAAQEGPQFELSPSTARIDGAVRITLALEGELRDLDVPEPPVENLRVVQGPRTGFEMHWSPGGLVRRRVYEWTAIATKQGRATVGPLWIGDSAGRRVLVPAASIEVAQGNEPQNVRLELEVSSPMVDLGEQVYATWTLVSTEPVRDLRIIENASFEGFWVEEIPITGQRDSIVWDEGERRHTLLLRRVVLYPLQTGALPIRPMRTEAEILVSRENQSPFSMFEGRFRTITAAADPLLIRVAERHPEAQVTGATSLQCGAPVVSQSGNVTWDVTVRSIGNLRPSGPPAFVGELPARTEADEIGSVVVERTVAGVRMTRKWKMLIFPERAGRLVVPDLVYRYWDADAATLREARCSGATLAVPERAAPAPTADRAQPEFERDRFSTLHVLLGLGVIALAAWWLMFRRRDTTHPAEAELIGRVMARGETREQRAAVEEWLRSRGVDPFALAWEENERGERWRAVLSLFETHERGVLSERNDEELERRLKNLARTI